MIKHSASARALPASLKRHLITAVSDACAFAVLLIFGAGVSLLFMAIAKVIN